MVPYGALDAPKSHFTFPQGDDLAPLDLEGLGFNPEQEPVERPKGYEGYHWLETVDGEGKLSIGPRSLVLGPGQGILLPPGLPHSYIANTWPWSTRYLTFRGPMAEVLVSSFGQATATPFQWPADSLFAGHLPDLINRFRSGSWETVRGRSTLVYQFLALLRDHGQAIDLRPVTVSEVNDRLRALFEHIEDHLDDPNLGVEDLANLLGVSPRHLNDLFAKAGQSSPYQYLKQRRLVRARQLLLWHRDLGVKEISFRVGFRDPSHFIHAFRQAVGRSPDQYRRTQAGTGASDR